MSLVQKSQAYFWGSRFQRCYRRRGSLSLAAAGGLPCSRASCRPMASAIRRMRGSSGSPLGDPLSLAGQGPFRSSSFAMPTLPRQGPSDKNSEETHGESRKFRPSTCGVEMLAGGEALLPYLHGEPRRAGDIRSRPRAGEPGARTARAFTGWRRSGPMATSRWGHRSPSQPRPAFPAETPFDAARIAHDALDTASAAQHFQLADMGMDVNLGVAADPSYPGAGGFKIRAGVIDAGIIRHVTDIGIPCLPEANVTRSNLSGRAARNRRYRRQSPPILRPGSVRATSVGQHALRRS